MRWLHFRASLTFVILLCVIALFAQHSVAAESTSQAAGEVVVRVIDEAGAPQSGASVSLFNVVGRLRLAIDAKRDQLADAAGIVRYDRLQTGVEYKLRATTSSHLLGFRECAISIDKSRAEADLRVSRPVGATIHVHDEAGKPIRDALIFALWNNGPKNGMLAFGWRDLPTVGLSSKRSDAMGNLPLPELSGGRMGFQLFHPNYVPFQFNEQTIEPGSTIDVTMHDGAKVDVELNVPQGTALNDGLRIVLLPERLLDSSTLMGALPDPPPDGKIRLTVAAGKYGGFFLSHPDYIVTPEYNVSFRQFELRGSGNRFTFQLRPKFKVRGQLLYENASKSAKGHFVLAEVDAGKQEGPFADFATKWSDAGSATADDHGEYEIELPVGRVRISARMGAVIAQPEYVEFDVSPDGTANIPNIFVRPIPKVRGVVLDPDGKPVPRAILRFRDSDRAWDGPVVADSQGRFELAPEGNSTDLINDKINATQTILAFHPYEALGAESHVSFADGKSCENVELHLVPQDYGFPVTGYPTEFASLVQWLSPKVREERAAMTRPGPRAPELDGALWLNIDKPKLSLADFRGRFVLLEFWTTWCGVCNQDHPRLDLAYDLYKDKGLTVVCVHDNSVPIDEIKKYVAEKKIRYPVVIDHEDGRILEAYKSLGVYGYPTYILVGPDGKIVGDPTQSGRGLWLYKLEILRQQLMSPQAGAGIALKAVNGKMLVGSILPDSVAARSNALKPDDRIIAVAEEHAEPVDVGGLELRKVVSLIRGRNGTVVRLTVIPAGKDESEARVISLTRGPVTTPLGGLGDGKPLVPGTAAPNFSFTRLSDGKEFDLSHYRGKVVVIEAWASWCKPCVEHIAKLETLEEDHPDWKGRVEVLAVSIDEIREDADACCKAHHWTKVPAVWSGPSLCDAYHIQGVPTAYIIDRNGKVVASDNRLDIPELIKQKNLLDGDGK